MMMTVDPIMQIKNGCFDFFSKVGHRRSPVIMHLAVLFDFRRFRILCHMSKLKLKE